MYNGRDVLCKRETERSSERQGEMKVGEREGESKDARAHSHTYREKEGGRER
jgi:hypothetical protein